jgi:putative membrane protein
VANVAFPFAFLPLLCRYITLRYRFDKEGVSVSHGLLWRRETYLTYARIQDIHVSRNIFERWLGLAQFRSRLRPAVQVRRNRSSACGVQ